MGEEKLACLFKTKKCLEIYIFDSVLHSENSINAFIKYEGKILEKKIYFKERVRTSPMISKDFFERYTDFHKDNKFLHLGYSSYCRYDFSREKGLKRAFEEYFLNYKDSLS